MKKLTWTFFAILGLSIFAQPSFALNWGEFRVAVEAVDAGGQPDANVVTRLQEIVNTVAIYTDAQRQQHPDSLIFCAPDLPGITLEEIAGGIRDQANAMQAADSVSVQELLMRALQANYPCS